MHQESMRSIFPLSICLPRSGLACYVLYDSNTVAGWSHSANWNSVLANFLGIVPPGMISKPASMKSLTVKDLGKFAQTDLRAWYIEVATVGSRLVVVAGRKILHFLAEEYGDLVEVSGCWTW